MQKKGEASKRQAGSEAGKGKGNETTDDDAGLEAGHRGRQETHRKEDKFDEDLAIHTEKYTKFMTNVLIELSRDVLDHPGYDCYVPVSFWDSIDAEQREAERPPLKLTYF